MPKITELTLRIEEVDEQVAGHGWRWSLDAHEDGDRVTAIGDVSESQEVAEAKVRAVVSAVISGHGRYELTYQDRTLRGRLPILSPR